MTLRSFLSSFLFLGAALASADHNWHLESSYTYSITGDVGTAVLRDLEVVMEGGFINDPSSGWGVSTSFSPGNANTLTLSLDTYPFFGTASNEPFLRESLLFGVMDNLPTDGSGAQKHLVLFMDPTASSRVQNIAYGTVFNTSNQSIQITEETLIDALEKVHTNLSDDEKKPYYEILDDFRNVVAREANVGPNGTTGSIWFAPQGFDIVVFSDGLTIGSGTNTFTAEIQSVPEPASMLVFGGGALLALRRRRRA